MISYIRNHNYLNGHWFSFLEYVIVAAILAPFAYYYVAHARMLYAACMLGIILNCLTVSSFALRSLLRKEESVGIGRLYADREARRAARAAYPHLARETLVLSVTVLVPFWIAASVVWELSRR